MVDDTVRRGERFDSHFDAYGSRREAQRDCRGVPGGAEVGERALLLFQVASEKSEVEADLFPQHLAQSDEGGRRQPDHFMPVKRA